MKKILLLVLFFATLIALVGFESENDSNYWRQEDIATQEELDMTVALYEAKLDWYELQYNIDLDDSPEQFESWLLEEYPDLFEYFN
jgi:hypothetical protein